MKKTSLLVALPAVALSGLLLSGCGMFRSHKAWETAQQKAPLEIPPALDRPSTTAALVIPPPGANQPTSSGATASVNGVPGQTGQVSDGFVHPGSVDNIYSRVGQVIAGGSVGQLVSHDDARHLYVVSLNATDIKQKKGFFGRMFGGGKSAASPEGTLHQAQIMIDSSGVTDSEIRVQSDSVAAVTKVMDALRSGLGKK